MNQMTKMSKSLKIQLDVKENKFIKKTLRTTFNKSENHNFLDRTCVYKKKILRPKILILA